MDVVAVIDFETTGLSPTHGARATEIAAVLVQDGKIVDRYQSLMNAEQRIPPFIEQYTGITNEMVRRAPSADKVMKQVAEFVGDHPLLAHNASFDCKFWDAELSRISYTRKQDFACSMLLSRRLYPNAPNHQLGTLIQYNGLPSSGTYHRALADAEMTAHLLLRITEDLKKRYRLHKVPHALLRSIQVSSKPKLDQCIERFFSK